MVKDDLMYIVGGSGINRYGDVFTFHFGSCAWRKMVCTGTDLSDGRYAHSAVLREGFIYLYGGNDGVRHDDLQQLDLETRVWSRVPVHGQCPPGRDFHAAVLRKDSMVIFGGSSGMRRHNDVFEFHMAPKIPACTLSADIETLLEQAQADEAAQWSCDVYLSADDGDSSQGVFCHSHLLQVRCRALHRLVREYMPSGELPAAGGTLEALAPEAAHHFDRPLLQTIPPSAAGEEAPAVSSAPVATNVLGPVASTEEQPGTKDQDDTIDSLLRSVTEDGTADVKKSSRAGRRPPPSWGTSWPHPRCVWVPVDMPYNILWHFVRYLYSETTKFGRLPADHLYRLFLAAKQFEVARLAALCERQIKVRLGLDNVLPLLRASALAGPAAVPVQEACKHFFLANYNQCTDLRECEALDPKLLCELMRLHNSRASPTVPPSSSQQRGNPLPPTAPVPLPPMSPQAATRAVPVEEPASRGAGKAEGANCRGDGVSCLGSVAIPPGSFSEDLKRLLIEEIEPDFEVVVQDEVIHAHKFVLVARSRYFASCILTSGMVEAQAGRLVIPSTSAMTADAFRAFLRFLYAGDDILGVLVPHTAMYLVESSSFYGLSNSRLKHFCELCVKDSFNEAHVLQLFEASSRLNVEAVRTMALEFIITHFHTVCRQPAMDQLDKPLLVDILKGLADRLPPVPAGNTMPGGQPQSLG
jgi:hypothetical protein